MIKLMRHTRFTRIAVPLLLAIALLSTLWFAVPTRALTIDISVPGSGNLGTSVWFQVKVNIEDYELLPIEAINIRIYNAANPATYFDRYTNLSLTATGAVQYGTRAWITATPGSDWGSYVYGYGNADWNNNAYRFFPPGGYGYGYSYAGQNTSITYDITWIPPTSWPTGAYRVETEIVASQSTVFTQTSAQFTLSSSGGGGGGAPPPPEGTYDADTAYTSADGRATLQVAKGTIGLLDGKALTGVAVVGVDAPPTAPTGKSFLGAVYEVRPAGAVFAPAVTLSITYNPAGTSETDLVLAYYDTTTKAWVVMGAVQDTAAHSLKTGITRAAMFAILENARPAIFSLSSLTITPAEANPGDDVKVSVVVTNSGGSAGTYRVVLKVDGAVESSKDVSLAAGANQTVTFITQRTDAGKYNVAVEGLAGTFTIKPAQPPTQPSFSLSGLTVTPDTASPGDDIDISVTVSNAGDTAGSYTLTLKINNKVESKKTVTVNGHTSQRVTFTIAKAKVGDYAVSIDNLEGAFTVREAPVVRSFNLWFVGGLVAGVLVIALVIWMFLRRRTF